MMLKISRSQVSTQPNPTHQKLKKNSDPTQPMDGPNPWPTLVRLRSVNKITQNVVDEFWGDVTEGCDIRWLDFGDDLDDDLDPVILAEFLIIAAKGQFI